MRRKDGQVVWMEGSGTALDRTIRSGWRSGPIGPLEPGAGQAGR
jgi:hypothetical protein